MCLNHAGGRGEFNAYPRHRLMMLSVSAVYVHMKVTPPHFSFASCWLGLLESSRVCLNHAGGRDSQMLKAYPGSTLFHLQPVSKADGK